MDILYKQLASDATLRTLNIENCYIKHLCGKTDSKTTFRKEHHHTGFEIHFMNKGQQKYIIDQKAYTLSDEHLLLIPPLKKHYVADTQFYNSKFSITFSRIAPSPFDFLDSVVFCKTDKLTAERLDHILEERKISSLFSKQIISHTAFEILVTLLRRCGYNEEKGCFEDSCEDDRLTIAKRYIKDNIEFNIKVSDVAAYCCLGSKQLTRLFHNYEKISPLCYIQKQKIKHIEALLLEGRALREISEKMSFSSEYHFNSFYKKYAGISPGTYKKMHIK